MFHGFRGHNDLAFIFSSVYFRVLPWLKLLLLTDTTPPKLTHYRFIYKSYFSVFFRGFRGHYDLAFIFSSVYFRVLPWQKRT